MYSCPHPTSAWNVPYDWEAVTTLTNVTTTKETMKILLDNHREQDVPWPHSLRSHIYVLVSFLIPFLAQQIHKKLLRSYRDPSLH